ncbi:MAG: TonB-dependent receptor [Ignavibacteriaceae bacterium]|nr:TonB-dependent receptor [Ignavibacteriaceae bacterium]
MKLFYTLLVLFILINNAILPQISGKILDDNTNLPVPDVTVTLTGLQIATTSDSAGLFSFNVPPSSYSLSFYHIGYKSFNTRTDFIKDTPPYLFIIHSSMITYGEVTVTSTRFEQPIRDVPLPMEIVNKDDILNSTSVSVPDVLQNQPGVAIARDGIWGTDISIRGLGRQNIVTLVDGNRIETASNHAATLDLVDMYDVDKIEIIKGGISSLYGTGAEGGIVNITTKTGTYTDRLSLSGSLTTGYNSVNQAGAGYLNLISSSSNWYAKISGTLRSALNTKTPDGTLLNSQYNDDNLSADLGVKPADNQELLLKYQRFHGEDIGIPGAKAFPTIAQAKYLLAERDMYSAEYKFKDLLPSLSNLSLKYYYQDIKRDVQLIVQPSASVTQTVTPSADHSTWGTQLLSNWTLSSLNQLSAGIDVWQRTFTGFRETQVNSPAGISITGDFPVPNSKYLSSGAFAQDESSLLDNKLKVNFGGRYDIIKVTNDDALNPSYIITNGIINNNPPHNSISSFYASSAQDKSWSGNLGLLYTLVNDVDVTFNIAHAFRSPVQEERFQYINLGGNIYLGNPNLKPEQGNFLDLGVRFWKPNYTFKGNVFLNNIMDLVIDQHDTGIVYRKANVGKARLYGYDFGFEYNFWTTLVTYGNLSYVRGEDLLNNINLPQITPLNGRLGIRLPVYNYLNADISSTLFAKQDNLGPAEIATPSYAVFDFYLNTNLISWNFFRLRLFGGVENIFNKSYREFLSTNRGIVKSEPGRDFFLKLQVNW